MQYRVYLPNVNVKMPHLNIIFANIDEPAYIEKMEGNLVINSLYIDQPLYLIYWLYGHEIAHYLYPTIGSRTARNEFKCDWFSARLMLLNGFNPSQILAAMKFILWNSPEHDYRYNKMLNTLSRVGTKFINL